MGAPEEEAPRPPSDITVYGANCSLHGLSHIFLPGGVTIRRLLWAAAFSSSLSFFLYQVADRVIEYYQYPHVTILDEMDVPVMYFPAITICNYNSYRKSQILRNDIFWMAGLLGVEQGDFDDFMAAVGQPTDNSKFFPSKSFNMLEFVQRASHSMDEMLLDCKYRGKDCGPENFTIIHMSLVLNHILTEDF
ncbi:Acid-sensing ion channel 3 [Dissostichus eleginoides]|uniref:Acid-sensing ion channel 3 n=1 Tax=Dissostichus eleginoides TaxID=100907 RepID=A0AAD9BBI3_DISEL|nr:Acid-sensing ion channel 3 [Dissostichus eleginoides]